MELNYIVKSKEYSTVRQIIKNEFNISARLVSKLKLNKKILLNQSPIYLDKKICIGDCISCNLDINEESKGIIPTKMDLNIIYEDDAYIVLIKPVNIPIHPSYENFENSLANGVEYYFKTNNIKRKIHIVNRLDKNTSGLVIIAKNEYIQENLAMQMKKGIFIKKYIAIVERNSRRKRRNNR